MLEAALAAIGESPLADAVRTSRVVYPIINAVHILGLAALFGAILALDLRLLGLMGNVPVRPLALALPRVAAGGLALAAATGALLFIVQPAEYVANWGFLVKVALVGAATAHALFVRRRREWLELAQGRTETARGLRTSALASLALWTAAIVAGRFIAFE